MHNVNSSCILIGLMFNFHIVVLETVYNTEVVLYCYLNSVMEHASVTQVIYFDLYFI
jgi:hypothetical protein